MINTISYKKLSIAVVLAAAAAALYLPALTAAQVVKPSVGPAAPSARPSTSAAQPTAPPAPAGGAALTPAQLAQARKDAKNSFAVRFLFPAAVLKPIFALKAGETVQVRIREKVSGMDVPFIAERNKAGFCAYADGFTFDATKSMGVVRAGSGLGLARLVDLVTKNPFVAPVDPQYQNSFCVENVRRAFSLLAYIVFDTSVVDEVLKGGGAALAAALKPVTPAPGGPRPPTQPPMGKKAAALFDFGDIYDQTTLAQRGVRHRIGGVWLGGAPQASAVDAEPDANRPDNDLFDDGLALIRAAVVPPPPDTVRVTRAPAPQGKKPLSAAYLNVLDDANGNGRWEPNEWVVQNQLVRFTTGDTQTVSLQNPSNKPVVLSRNGGVRITVSLQKLQNYRGLAPKNLPLSGGETEDYLFGQKGGVPPICPALPIPQCAEGMVSQTSKNAQGCPVTSCVPGGPTIDTGGLTPPSAGGSCGANQDCPNGQTCNVVNNVGTCVVGTSMQSKKEKCRPGESRCLSREQFQQCRKDGTWEVPQNCPIDTECDSSTGECTQTLRPTIPVAR